MSAPRPGMSGSSGLFRLRDMDRAARSGIAEARPRPRMKAVLRFRLKTAPPSSPLHSNRTQSFACWLLNVTYPHTIGIIGALHVTVASDDMTMKAHRLSAPSSSGVSASISAMPSSTESSHDRVRCAATL